MQLSRTWTATAPLLLVFGLLASGGTAVAESCSNNTLQGSYGFTIEGLALPAPGVTVPLRGVAMTHFDGKGNLTQVDHVVFNGVPPAIFWTPGSGTYQVNEDCTGSAQIKVPASGEILNLAFVLVKQGKEIRTVVNSLTEQGQQVPVTVTSIGIRSE